MKISFFSNYLNQLQIPLCNELYRLLSDDFKFVSTEPLPLERLDSGYTDCSHFVYNINSFSDKESYEKAMRLGIESDIVIIGSAPEDFIKDRIKTNKIIFRYHERFFKKGDWMLFDIRILYALIKNHTFYRNKNIYMLCASAFTKRDLKFVFAYPNKFYKWGYFTDVSKESITEILNKKNISDCINIIWVARFIKWKHPEMVVNLAKMLKFKGYNFKIKMFGQGELFIKIRELIYLNNLKDYVTLEGSVSNEEIRIQMQMSDIFILTSDRNEGWGAVLNEAMSNACACVVDEMVGSAPFLITSQEYGLKYKTKNLKCLTSAVEYLINNKDKRLLISRNSFNRINSIWSPKIAAERLIEISKTLLNGTNNNIYAKGPLSKF